MSKYLIDHQPTGACTINVDSVCKDWDARFFISTWINESQETYTLVIMRKGGKSFRFKVQISKTQAMALIEALKLIHVKSTLFTSAGNYRDRQSIIEEISRLTKIKREKEFEIDIIQKTIFGFERSL